MVKIRQVEVTNDKRIDKYEILKVLSVEKNRRVLQVKDQSSNEILAIKEVSLDKGVNVVGFALTEVRVLASISSPFIIQFKEAMCDMKNQLLFIVMEYASAGTLREKFSSFNDKEILKIIKQILCGLSLLHDHKIIHGDINLDNILLFSEGSLSYKIGDFDRSKCPSKDFEIEQIAYQAPETFSCKMTIKNDIWALGCMLYHILEGNPPFQASNRGELKRKIINENYKLSTTNQVLRNLVRRMLDKNPNSRPDCHELLKEFYEIKSLDSIKQTFKLIDLPTLPSLSPLATLDQHAKFVQYQNSKDFQNILSTGQPIVLQLTSGLANNQSFYILKPSLLEITDY